MGISNILALLGGVALFLYGMSLMGDSLKLVAGQKLEIVLYKLTNTPIKGVLLGTAVTAVIQSSSATSAMVVGFVNSGMIQFSQAIGLVLGSNVGTSITGWILCLSNISGENSALSLLSTATITAVVALIGIILRMTGKTKQKKYIGDILLGFAVLMYGMSAMSSSVAPLKTNPGFIRLMTMFKNPILAMIIGMLITSVLQSNSASVGILQALSVTGVITAGTVIPMIMGMGVGASVPVLMSAIGTNRDGHRTALVYLIMSLFGAVFYSMVFYALNSVFHFAFLDAIIGPVGIACINTVFRIVTCGALMPFFNVIDRATAILVKETADQKKKDELTTGIERLEERFIPHHVGIAIDQSRFAMEQMALRSQDNLVAAFELMAKYDEKSFQTVVDIEDAVDKYEDKLGTYLMKITACDLTERQSEDVTKYLHTISDFERISDHALNLAEAAREIYEKGIDFSDEATHELDVLRSAAGEIVSIAVGAFIYNDIEMAKRIEPLEEVIDGLCDELKLHHIIRLQEGGCTLGTGFVFNDLLTNYERVADHCSNIAVAMIELEAESFDRHEYLNSLKEMKTEKFTAYYDEYSQKFNIV